MNDADRPAEAEKVYTLIEVAAHLKSSVPAVRVMIAANRLRAVCLKPGKKSVRHIRVRASDLDACIRALADYAGCPSQRPKLSEPD